MKRFRIISLTLLLTCCHIIGISQLINIRTYSIEDGLVNNDILNIYQDSQGFIWLCTRGGLSRYDGTRFTNYTTANGLTNDMINDIYEVSPQQFLIAQNMGGPRIMRNGRIEPFGSDSTLTLNSFYRHHNELWATSDKSGIVKWNKDNFTLLNPSYQKDAFRIEPLNDSVWVILKENYYFQLLTANLLPYSTSTNIVATAIKTDSHNRTWIGTAKGLLLLDTLQKKNKPVSFLPLPPAFNLPILRKNHIQAVFEDSKHNHWIATMGGLVQIQPNGNSRVFTDRDGLPGSFINCLFEDRQHNIWAGSPLGLAKFSSGDDVKIFTQKDGLSMGSVTFVLPVSQHKVQLVEGGNTQYFSPAAADFSPSPIQDLSNYLGYKTGMEEILLAKKSGGKLIKKNTTAIETIPWPDTLFDCVMRLDEEHFLTSRSNILYIVSRGNMHQKLSINIIDRVFCLLPGPKGVVWVGTMNCGLYKINWQYRQQTISFRLTDSLIKELPDRHIRTLYTDKENELWIGTRYKGLVRLQEKPNGKHDIQHFGTEQGLSSNFVRVIKRDPMGNIWAGTMQGLDKLIPSGNHYRIFNFGRVNKIFYPIYDLCFLETGYLLAAGYPNVIYARDAQQDTLAAYPVYITKVYTGTKDTINTTMLPQINLPHNNAQIYFEFSSPQLVNEDFTEYSYRLLGSNDSSWRTVGKTHSVNFASLQPGKYTFEIKALGFNGLWGPETKYAFTVITPYWQKAWFIIVLAIAVGLLIYALYRYRVKQLLRLQKVRNRIATDLHDEIGSNLTNISILSSLSKRNLSQPKEATVFLQRISEEVTSSSQALDDIIWSVNTDYDTLEETAARMRRYAAELFNAANTHCELYLDPAFEERKLTMEQRRDIYLLYKEAVNNIFKHAQAQNVNIKITIEHNHLFLYIKDDGKGFETGAASNRHGLKGMKERVKKWKGEIHIESAENKGAAIEIRFPIAR